MVQQPELRSIKCKGSVLLHRLNKALIQRHTQASVVHDVQAGGARHEEYHNFAHEPAYHLRTIAVLRRIPSQRGTTLNR